VRRSSEDTARDWRAYVGGVLDPDFEPEVLSHPSTRKESGG
jgi:hypothetical protein